MNERADRDALYSSNHPLQTKTCELSSCFAGFYTDLKRNKKRQLFRSVASSFLATFRSVADWVSSVLVLVLEENKCPQFVLLERRTSPVAVESWNYMWFRYNIVLSLFFFFYGFHIFTEDGHKIHEHKTLKKWFWGGKTEKVSYTEFDPPWLLVFFLIYNWVIINQKILLYGPHSGPYFRMRPSP